MTPKAPSSAPTPRFTLAELAERSGGQAEGDRGFVLSGVAGLAEAGPRDVTFVEGARQVPTAAAGCAGAIFLPAGLELPGRNLIRVENPRLAFAEALALFHPAPHPPAGIHPTAVVEPGAVVDPTASVAAFCFVGAGARIGARAVLHPFVHVGAGRRDRRRSAAAPRGDRARACHPRGAGHRAPGRGHRQRRLRLCLRRARAPQDPAGRDGRDRRRRRDRRRHDRSTAPPPARRASAAGRRSTTSCRSPTT